MKKIFINEFFSDKNEKLVNIEAKRLKRDFLTENDIKRIKRHFIRIKINNYIGYIYSIPFLFLFLYLLKCVVSQIIEDFNVLNVFGIIMLLIGLRFILTIIISVIKNISNISEVMENDDFKGQYGKAYNKYSEIKFEKNSDNGETQTHEYFVDVVFPRDKTIINRIKIDFSTYLQLDKEDDVIVFSYNGEKCYCIKKIG